MASIARIGLCRSAAVIKPTGSLAYYRPAAATLVDLRAHARGPLVPDRALLVRNLSVSLKPSDGTSQPESD